MRLADRFKSRMERRSSYQRIPFYAIKLLQLVSCVVDFAIIAYFVSNLRSSYAPVPWTFIIHLTGFTISTVILAFTISVYAATTPPSKISIILNGALLAFLALSFGLLTRTLRVTLTKSCGIESWNNSTGIMVCRLYKTLFSFEVIAILTTLAALALDFYTLSVSRTPGAYIRTESPKSGGFEQRDSEYRGLITPSYTNGSKSSNNLDGPPSFPSTPGLPDSEETELSRLEPADIDGNDRGMSFLVPSSAYRRVSERGYNPPEGI